MFNWFVTKKILIYLKHTNQFNEKFTKMIFLIVIPFDLTLY